MIFELDCHGEEEEEREGEGENFQKPTVLMESGLGNSGVGKGVDGRADGRVD